MVTDYFRALHAELAEARAEIARLTAERDACHLLIKRLAGWDHLDTAGDGAYWRREMTALLLDQEAAK